MTKLINRLINGENPKLKVDSKLGDVHIVTKVDGMINDPDLITALKRQRKRLGVLAERLKNGGNTNGNVTHSGGVNRRINGNGQQMFQRQGFAQPRYGPRGRLLRQSRFIQPNFVQRNFVQPNFRRQPFFQRQIQLG